MHTVLPNFNHGWQCRERFAICVRSALFIETKELHIVEWIELNLRLGISKIIIYIIYLSPLMMKILKHYSQLGKVCNNSFYWSTLHKLSSQVDFYYITYPGTLANTPYQATLLYNNMSKFDSFLDHYSYSDCFMRYRHKYQVDCVLSILWSCLCLLSCPSVHNTTRRWRADRTLKTPQSPSPLQQIGSSRPHQCQLRRNHVQTDLLPTRQPAATPWKKWQA